MLSRVLSRWFPLYIELEFVCECTCPGQNVSSDLRDGLICVMSDVGGGAANTLYRLYPQKTNGLVFAL